MSYQQIPLKFAPGINPEPDETEQNTAYIVEANNVRFRQGNIEKMGGWEKGVLNFVDLQGGYLSGVTNFVGCPRSAFSFEENDNQWEVIGTHSKLYAKLGSTVYNITPLQSSGDTLGSNPIATRYDDIQVTPFTTTDGSDTVAVTTFLFDEVQPGNTIEISGVVGSGGTLNGIPIAEINTTHTIVSLNAGTGFNIRVSTNATSSGSPTESNSVIAMKAVKITDSTHGLSEGDRISISGATGPIGGIPASEINGEHIISVIETANTYVIPVSTTPTSLTSGGGSSVERIKEIAAGNCDAAAATGPYIGTPWLGLPWEPGTDTSLTTQPRIWWHDAYGDTWVGGPGQGGAAYQWDGDETSAPTAISNAPAADWGWIEDEKLVILNGNTFTNSDTGDLTNWSSGSYFSDDKEDARTLIYREYVNGENIIFDDAGRAFRTRFVGGNVKWVWERIDGNIPIMGPLASFQRGGSLFVFGRDNLYIYNGNTFTPLQNNTLYRYLYDNYNSAQRYKFFCWYNQQYDEIWFHYATQSSNENDRVVILGISDGHFNKLEDIDRTCANRSALIGNKPILIDSDGEYYQHETGYDNDTSALNSYFKLYYTAIADGNYLTEVEGMEPDGIITGDMTVTLYGKDRMQGSEVTLHTATINDNTKQFECEEEARWRSWEFRSNELSGYYRLGRMTEFVNRGSKY